MIPINVLSLFDGISCGRVALDRANIPVNKYFASELDKYAIQVAKKNYPDTIHIWDVTQVKYRDTSNIKIDLLIGWSPCQGFSFAGKQLNFQDPRSKLFFEYVRILKEAKPRFFIMENVRMKKEYQDIISEHLWVEPIMINSSLLSAQNRVRLYWVGERQEDGTYKQVKVSQPEDKGQILKDILQDEVEENFNLSSVQIERFLQNWNTNPSGNWMNWKVCSSDWKSPTLTTNKWEWLKVSWCAQRWRYTQNGNTEQRLEEREDEKANCLTSVSKDSMIVQRPRWKNNWWVHTEKCPTLTSNEWQHNNKLCIQVWMADDINWHDFLKRIYDPKWKSPTLTAVQWGNQERKIAIDEVYYRKLTPIECERLQTLPDNYTDWVSNSQRYKQLGNGWTVDVIAHIIKHLWI